MGELRQRMREEMVIRGYSESTIETYLAQVRRFAKHLTRPLEDLEPDVSMIDGGAVGRRVNGRPLVCSLAPPPLPGRIG